MSKLLKITNITKAFAKQFGDTTEGLGYKTIVALLEGEEKAVPYTIKELRNSIIDKLREHGVKDSWISLTVETYGEEIRYKVHVLNVTIERRTPSKFYKDICSSIEENASEYLKEQAKKNKERDISL